MGGSCIRCITLCKEPSPCSDTQTIGVITKTLGSDVQNESIGANAVCWKFSDFWGVWGTKLYEEGETN